MFGSEDVPLSDDDSLVEKGLIDSTGVLELIGFLEERFGVEIRDTEMVPENLDSIHKLLRFLDNKNVTARVPGKQCRPLTRQNRSGHG
jgi:acyl carrier protein